MLITSDDNLKEYISTILAQVQGMSSTPHSNPLNHKAAPGPLIIRMAPNSIHKSPSPSNQINRNKRDSRTLAI
jgi:hypothetical protein